MSVRGRLLQVKGLVRRRPQRQRQNRQHQNQHLKRYDLTTVSFRVQAPSLLTESFECDILNWKSNLKKDSESFKRVYYYHWIIRGFSCPRLPRFLVRKSQTTARQLPSVKAQDKGRLQSRGKGVPKLGRGGHLPPATCLPLLQVCQVLSRTWECVDSWPEEGGILVLQDVYQMRVPWIGSNAVKSLAKSLSLAKFFAQSKKCLPIAQLDADNFR